MTDERGAIAFAEKVLVLLEEGRFTATYEYAVLLGLLDLVIEQTERTGAPPDALTTRQLAGLPLRRRARDDGPRAPGDLGGPAR
jgi:hypothetical protein